MGTHKNLGPNLHAIDRDKPEEHLLARSRDGGLTWQVENPSAQGTLVPVGKALRGSPPPGLQEKPWRDCPGGIDFTHPDFAMTLCMSDKDTGWSRSYCSTDRGHNWEGPFRLPLFGQKGTAARTDYLVNRQHDCMVLLTAAKQNSEQGRVICGHTTDGGKTWSFVSYIGPEPTGYSFMPSILRLSPTEILTTIGCREESGSWIDTYVSRDNSASWSYLNCPVPDTGEGNPPALIRLHNGRLCPTYGYRVAPWEIYTRLSNDGGRTWSTSIALCEDGTGRDIGYWPSVERPDGKIVTI